MKKILCLLSLFATLSAQAQFTRLTRHPDIPVQYDAAFVDLVKGYYSGTVKSSYGQYFGHLSPDQNVYGYGTFFTDQDGEICGQFRNGDLIVGIRMGTAIVRVGTEDHYTAYDLLTGEPQYVFLNDEKYKLDAEHLASWRYVQLAYKNGDKYVGETVDGKRDGYGIYYYANGNFYFGRYKDNKAVGYGALFKTDNHVSIQYWDGPSEAEQDAAAQAELEAAAAAAEAAQKPEKKPAKRRNVNAWSR
jgi:hypothetical protein